MIGDLLDHHCLSTQRDGTTPLQNDSALPRQDNAGAALVGRAFSGSRGVSQRAISSAWHRRGAHQHRRRSDSPRHSRRCSSERARLRADPQPCTSANRSSRSTPCRAAIASTSSRVLCGTAKSSANAVHTASRNLSSVPRGPMRKGFPRGVVRSTTTAAKVSSQCASCENRQAAPRSHRPLT
jgi:hypothetical protein